MTGQHAPPEERFWAKVDAAGVCWEWTGARMKKNGYGVFNVGSGRGTALAHRFAFATLVGDPGASQLDHLCRNRVCVNPDHLEPVDQRTNLLRGAGVSGRNSRKRACPTCGSPYSPQIVRGAAVGRYCRPCQAAWQLARYYRLKGAASV